MRKLILITVMMLASASAFAGESRSLTLASNDVLAAPSQPTVDRASVSKVAVRLAQAAAPATVQTDAAPALPQTTTTTTQAPAAAPVQTATPAATTEPAATTTTTTADTQPAAKPAKTATKTTKRESDEHKARRIAAKYGVYW